MLLVLRTVKTDSIAIILYYFTPYYFSLFFGLFSLSNTASIDLSKRTCEHFAKGVVSSRREICGAPRKEGRRCIGAERTADCGTDTRVNKTHILSRCPIVATHPASLFRPCTAYFTLCASFLVCVDWLKKFPTLR